MTIRYELKRILDKFFVNNEELDEKLTDKTSIRIKKSQIEDFPINMAPTSHTHNKEDITDFNHVHNKSQITDFNHTHTKSQISDFPTAMNPTTHTHDKNDINDFPTTMNPTSHTHKKADITDFTHTHNQYLTSHQPVDSSLNSESTHPVQNQVVTSSINALNNYMDTGLVYKLVEANNNYNVNLGDTIFVNMYIKNLKGVSKNPTSGLTLVTPVGYKDITGTRKADGSFQFQVQAEHSGLYTFIKENCVLQVNVEEDTGWNALTYAPYFKKYDTPLSIRKIGNVVQIRGTAKPKDDSLVFSEWTTYWEVANIPEKYCPSETLGFVCQASTNQRVYVMIKEGILWVGRFTKADSSGYYELPGSMWLPIFITYFVE